ncbi:serine/threonine-protein kinase [Melissospora conviva]|uniref:serine/threonine-protein kinase n=1 Tax=Melissospora conviva TaxID=3388432 RepID=UPI003C1C916F
MTLNGRYSVGRFPLAHKGMGEVWPAQDTLLDRAVIVKLISSTRPDIEFVRRFRREALLTARLDHPGVPAIYDLGEHAGRPYVVLHKVNGISLTDLVAEHGPLPIEWVAAIGAQVSSVLLAAKNIGLVHRDIKPSNVMLETSGAVKVLDFGLAVIGDDDRYSHITQTGQSLGTVGYMSPEQVFGEPVDHRTDLYGLGATLFHLLTAQLPFEGVTTTTMLRNQIDTPPPRPSQARPEVPAVLDDLVHDLMAIRPQDRPATAAEVYAALAPLSRDLPPIPGVFDSRAVEPVQAYSAIVGRVVAPPTHAAAPAADDPAAFASESASSRADQLMASGEFRAAARLCRLAADAHARQHGDDHPLVFDLRRRAARAHASLGEHGRAIRLLNTLLQSHIRADGQEHETVLSLRQEIDQLSREPSQLR